MTINKKPWTPPRFDVRWTASRAAFILLIGLVAGAPLVFALSLGRATINSDQLGTTAAVPLITIYVIVRLAGALIEPLPKAKRQELEAWREDGGLRKVMYFLSIALSLCLVIGIVSSVSALELWLLSLNWAAEVALAVSRNVIVLFSFLLLASTFCSIVHRNRSAFVSFWRNAFTLSTGELRLEVDYFRTLFKNPIGLA